MAQYLYLIYSDETHFTDLPPAEAEALTARHIAFAKAVADRGATMLGGAALQPSSTSTTVRGAAADGTGALLTDGPFLTVKEQLGGFYLLDVPDLDVALELARLCPAPDGGLELRPVLEMDMG